MADPQSICWVKCSLTSSSSRFEVVDTSRTSGGHPGTQSGTQSQSSLEELIGGKISSSRTLRALVAGMTSRGRPMYIGRVSCSSGIYIGHIDPDQATCFYPYRGGKNFYPSCNYIFSFKTMLPSRRRSKVVRSSLLGKRFCQQGSADRSTSSCSVPCQSKSCAFCGTF